MDALGGLCPHRGRYHLSPFCSKHRSMGQSPRKRTGSLFGREDPVLSNSVWHTGQDIVLLSIQSELAGGKE